MKADVTVWMVGWALFWIGISVSIAVVSCNDEKKPVVIDTVEPTVTASATATATATSTPLPTPQLSHGPGTLVGKTPTIGYVLICSDGVQTWQQLSLVVTPNWPPSEVCE